MFSLTECSSSVFDSSRHTKEAAVEIGDVIHLNGIKAEYRLYGKRSFFGCIMPDGDYVVLDFEQGHTYLAWSEAGGYPSRKHRYRVDDTLLSNLRKSANRNGIESTNSLRRRD